LFITTPLELVKVTQQLEKRKNLEIGKILKGIVKHRGISGIYRGFAVNTSKDVMNCGTYFVVYNNLKEYGIKNEYNSIAYHFLIGGCSSNKYLIKFRFVSLDCNNSN